MDKNLVDKVMEGYEEARESYLGWCKICQKYTRDCTEPDATRYDCPVCGNPHSVVGADIILMSAV